MSLAAASTSWGAPWFSALASPPPAVPLLPGQQKRENTVFQSMAPPPTIPASPGAFLKNTDSKASPQTSASPEWGPGICI